MENKNEIGFIHGNLLDFPRGITSIAHCCNTMNVMGAGIAKQIADRYSEAKKADDEADKVGLNTLGEFSFADVKLDDERSGKIFNLYTQERAGFGREVNYEALYKNLLLLRNRLNFLNEKCLGIPHGMSSGLAGGSWKIVYAMIEHLFEGPQAYFKTYIVKYGS
jgi:O-acetyl-ADP-ribose deacetylase (regulator of RNase III)